MEKLAILMKSKFLNLPQKFYAALESIMMTDSENVKREQFKSLLVIFKENKDGQLNSDFESVFLTVYLIEVYKEFNRDLLEIIKSKIEFLLIRRE
jgi:hypothetical protein